MSLYIAKDLKKVYDGRTVLDLPELKIGAGDMVALLGPNGAGKTTLLHVLAFLMKPTAGHLWFKDQPIDFNSTSLHRLRRQVVLVEQYPILFSTTVAKNVAFGLKLRGLDSREINRRVVESLDMVGMRAFAATPGRHLSGGETQRVAIARAIACQPQVVLLDEPTSNVDLENRTAIESIMRNIRDAHRSAIVFCTHDLTQAARLTESRLHLADGRLNGGDWENIFQAMVHPYEDRCRGVVGEGLTIDLPPMSDDRVRVTLNPHRIELYSFDPGQSRPENGCGRVVQMLEDGDGVRLMVDVGVPLVVILTIEAYAALDVHIGDTVGVRCPADAIILL